jgi:hypothetical protein
VQYISIHGNIRHPDRKKGQIHFTPDDPMGGIFLEWPTIFDKHNVTKQEKSTFKIQDENQVHIHSLVDAFLPNDDKGNFLMRYDDKLEDWFEFVVSRANLLHDSTETTAAAKSQRRFLR